LSDQKKGNGKQVSEIIEGVIANKMDILCDEAISIHITLFAL